MGKDALLGCVIIGFSLVILSYLTWWSRNMIERIARRGPASAREILKGVHRE